MKEFRKSCVLIIAVTLASAALPYSATAQEETPIHPYLSEKFFASVGIFRPDQKLNLGLEASVTISNPDPAPYVDFAQSFGFDGSQSTGSAEFGWRFGEKWMLRGQYFRVDNDSRATLEEDTEWGGYVFNQGTSVGVGTDFQITRLFFGRKFNSTISREFGLGLGLHVLDISAFINGNATVDGVDVGFRQERASISQPLPNFGAWYVHAFSPKWVATMRLDWLQARIDEYDGRIINAAATVAYAVNDNFGIGLAYNYFEIDLKVDELNWNGRIISRFSGPYISLTGYW